METARQNDSQRSRLKMKVASLTPGTRSKWLWLLPSGPDQIDHSAMRGDPPDTIVPQRHSSIADKKNPSRLVA